MQENKNLVTENQTFFDALEFFASRIMKINNGKTWIPAHFEILSLVLVANIVWKLLKMSHLNFGISTNFWPIKIDLSGNTVWPQTSGFQKLAKNGPFLAFLINFFPLKM